MRHTQLLYYFLGICRQYCPANWTGTRIVKPQKFRELLILKLLVTGGAGYIGTHSIIELLNAGHDISVIDDLSNSHIAALQRVRKLNKRNLAFMQPDLCDTAAVSA